MNTYHQGYLAASTKYLRCKKNHHQKYSIFFRHMDSLGLGDNGPVEFFINTSVARVLFGPN